MQTFSGAKPEAPKVGAKTLTEGAKQAETEYARLMAAAQNARDYAATEEVGATAKRQFWQRMKDQIWTDINGS